MQYSARGTMPNATRATHHVKNKARRAKRCPIALGWCFLASAVLRLDSCIFNGKIKSLGKQSRPHEKMHYSNRPHHDRHAQPIKFGRTSATQIGRICQHCSPTEVGFRELKVMKILEIIPGIILELGPLCFASTSGMYEASQPP